MRQVQSGWYCGKTIIASKILNLMTKSNSVDNPKMDPVHRDGDKTNVVDALANVKNNVSLIDVADGAKTCTDIYEVDRGNTKDNMHVDRDGMDGTLVDNVWLSGVKGVVGNSESSAAGDVE